MALCLPALGEAEGRHALNDDNDANGLRAGTRPAPTELLLDIIHRFKTMTTGT
jgi:hypothetical protein